MTDYRPQPPPQMPERIFSSEEMHRPMRLGRLAALGAVSGLLVLGWLAPDLTGDAGRLDWMLLVAALIAVIAASACGLTGFFTARRIRRESQDRHSLYGAASLCITSALLGFLGAYIAGVIAVMALFGALIAAVVAVVVLVLVVVILTNVDY